MNGTSGTPTVPDICPVCGKTGVSETWEEQTFPFGSDSPVDLHVRVPVMTCAACGFSFTDDRAAQIRHDEACRYQNLVTPDEIRRVREDVYGMSRREFEKSFGISEASLERWENRKLFPSRQATTLLRLLEDQAIGQRAIEQLHHSKQIKKTDRVSPIVGRFRALTESPALREKAREFKLRPHQMAA